MLCETKSHFPTTVPSCSRGQGNLGWLFFPARRYEKQTRFTQDVIYRTAEVRENSWRVRVRGSWETEAVDEPVVISGSDTITREWPVLYRKLVRLVREGRGAPPQSQPATCSATRLLLGGAYKTSAVMTS